MGESRSQLPPWQEDFAINTGMRKEDGQRSSAVIRAERKKRTREGRPTQQSSDGCRKEEKKNRRKEGTTP